jgi:hypothetical protein
MTQLPVGPTIEMSWAKMNAYEQCQLMFDLKYKQKIKLPGDQSVYIVGGAVHDAFKEWAEAGYPRSQMEPIARRCFANRAAAFRRTPSEKIEAWRTRAVKAANAVENMSFVLKFPDHRPSIEHRFKIALPSAPHVRLVGGYDVYDPAGVATLYDWKMYSKYEPPSFGQLLLYAVGLRAEGSKVGRLCFLYPLLPKKYDALIVTPEMLDRVEARAVEVAASLHPDAIAKRQPAQPEQGSHCRYCEYRGRSHCPATFRAGHPSRDGRAYKMGFRSVEG